MDIRRALALIMIVTGLAIVPFAAVGALGDHDWDDNWGHRWDHDGGPSEYRGPLDWRGGGYSGPLDLGGGGYSGPLDD